MFFSFHLQRFLKEHQFRVCVVRPSVVGWGSCAYSSDQWPPVTANHCQVQTHVSTQSALFIVIYVQDKYVNKRTRRTRTVKAQYRPNITSMWTIIAHVPNMQQITFGTFLNSSLKYDW
jgi:hypothetical protein